MTPIRSSSAGRAERRAPRSGAARPRTRTLAALLAVATATTSAVAVVLHAEAAGATPVGTDAATLWFSLACGAVALSAGIAGLGGRATTPSLLLAVGAAAWPISLWGQASFLSLPTLFVWALAGGVCTPLVAAAGLQASDHRRRSLERGLLLALLLSCIAGTLATALLTDPSLGGCFRCTPNVFAIADAPSIARALTRVALGVTAVAAVALAIAATARAVSAWRAGRRAGPLLLLPTAAWLLATGVRAAAEALSERVATPFHPVLISVCAATLLSIGVAALWIRARVIGARDDAAAFLAELSAVPRQSGARELLARALGEPDLTLAFPQSDGVLIDRDGGPLPEDIDRGRTELWRNGELIAVLGHGPQLLDEPDRIEQAATGAWLAIEADRSAAGLEHRERELQRARIRLVTAYDDERRHLFRDLHDGIQPRLVALALHLEVLRMTCSEDTARELIDDARQDIGAAVSELRRVAALTWSTLLAERGLRAAIRGLDETVPWRVELIEPSVDFEPPIDSAVYAVVAAAAAHGPVTVRAHADGTTAVAEVDCAAPPNDTSALVDRIEGAGGRLQVVELPDGAAQLRLDFARTDAARRASETVA